MATREELRGQWNELKGRLQEHWGQLTDEDLTHVRGSTDRLVGVVQQKTGATKSEIEDFLSKVIGDGERFGERVSDAAGFYAEAAQEYATEASEYLRDGAQRAANLSADYSQRLSHTIRTRPTESLAIAFGLGIAAGALFFVRGRR